MPRTWRTPRCQLDPWSTASVFATLGLLAIGADVALDSGYGYDEELQRVYGDLILAWYRSGFTDQSALDYRDLYLYGGLFDLVAQWLVALKLLPLGVYEARHVMTACIGVLGIVATWKMAKQIAGRKAGLLAALTLALTPAWVGHSMFNPKDIPFATAAAFVAYTTIAIALRPAPLRWRDALAAVVAYGIALGVRPGGLFLGGFPIMAVLGRAGLDWLEHHPPRRLLRNACRGLLKLVCLLPIAWALMLVAWPWAQLDPLRRPFEAASIASHFGWAGHMLFHGRVISGDAVPLSYLPMWFAVTLPELYWFAAFSGVATLVLSLKRRRISRRLGLAISCLAAFVAVPYLGVVMKRPVIYDAHRHFLFVLPPMAALLGVGLSRAAGHGPWPRALRRGGAVLWVMLAALVLFDMKALHPYEYVYFNRLYGGLPAAEGNFETDYWGTSFREGFAWVIAHVPPKSRRPIRVAACDDSPGRWQLEYMREHWKLQKQYAVIHDFKRAHRIYLAYTRNGCHRRRGKLLHVVERQGVPLLYVIRQ